MSIRNLDALFRPRSLAVIGASDRPQSIGQVLMKNLLSDAFDGPVMPVNPSRAEIAGKPAFPTVDALPQVPDLAIICTPPNTVPDLVAQLGRKGTRAAIVVTAGVDQQAILDAAKPHLMRILGPNCLGLLVPPIGLNASFAPSSLKPGPIAFATQSGGMATAVLDWAAEHDIGFSHFISMGNSADVDFGDVIDYLARDPETRAILLYIEAVTGARKFLSAARAASRNKPIIAIKAGRQKEGASAAASHTGALAGRDDVYDAALQRAGILRVDTTDELFDAVETLARATPLYGDRLAIVTNGGGPGVMAVDALMASGGNLTHLSDDTIAALDKVLPETWSRSNPVDIIGDAPGSRYGQALDAVMQDPNADAVLIMHVPTAVSSAIEVAQGVIEKVKNLHRTVLTSWIGGRAVAPARQAFEAAGIPSYGTPAAAVGAFLQIVRYRRLQQLLIETPSSVPETSVPDAKAAHAIIACAMREGRTTLSEVESKNLLENYGIPVVATRVTRNAEEAVNAANQIGYPVVVKVLSKDISHKSDIGGVALSLASDDDVRDAISGIEARAQALRPDASIEGFTVQQMIQRPRAHELLIGAALDTTFGPILMFGQGGTAVEVIADRAVALPPLNMAVAQHLIEGTRVYKLLQGYRDRPPADLNAIKRCLISLAQIMADHSEIAEIDINPMLADDQGAIALDARIIVAPNAEGGAERFAIKPYPSGLEEVVTLRSGIDVLMRPIKPEDEAAHGVFFDHLEREDIRFRFFNMIKHPGHAELARFTQIDYDREMCFIATHAGESGEQETMGVVRALRDPDNERAEYSIIVRSDIKGQGLGYALMTKIVSYLRAQGTGGIFGFVLHENAGMLAVVDDLGFERRPGPDPSVVEVALRLSEPMPS